MDVNLHVRQTPNKGDQTVYVACSFTEHCQAAPTGQLGEQNTLTVCALTLSKRDGAVSMVLKLVNPPNLTIAFSLHTHTHAQWEVGVVVVVGVVGFRAINASLHQQLLTHRSLRIRPSDENEKRGLIL